MADWRRDPSFYPSPQTAGTAPAEKLAYVALASPEPRMPDAIGVLDLDLSSISYGQLIHRLDMPAAGDELHHLGWNACSSCLCPYASRPHLERRYLIVPGLRSSRIHVVDTRPDPRKPRIIRVIEPEEVIARTGYSRPHTSHCGPDGIYIDALGAPAGDGPGGIFVMDPESFDITGRWESDRGPQYPSCNFRWHLGHGTLITSEWRTPKMVEEGIVPELLLGGRYGHALHVWDLHSRRHVQRLDLGAEQQMVLELRPAHDPGETYGFAGVALSLTGLSASVWIWYREGGNGTGSWKVRKVIDIPAHPADPGRLPPLLKGFGAVPPLVTHLNLSLDDRSLYVSCFGTGELRRYDVSDPFHPVHTGSIQLGGIGHTATHAAFGDQPINGGPQTVEISRDGRRVYVTNSLYRTWDEQFYPEGIAGWLAKIDVDARGAMRLDPRCFVRTEGMRPHQVRLEAGDTSSDSYCFSGDR